jgi:hypothetical protein
MRIARIDALAYRPFAEAHLYELSFLDPFTSMGREERHAYELELGWPVLGRIELYAQEGSKDDALVLGHLAFAVAEHFGGVIDFGEELEPADGVYRTEAQTAAFFAALPGRMYEVAYETREGDLLVRHVCDGRLMRDWLRHPAFAMGRTP